MAPDGKPGWKRQCTTCNKEIETQNVFFDWHNMTCISCFSNTMAKLMWEISEPRIVKCKNGYTIAWMNSLNCEEFYSNFEITQEFLDKM